VKDHVAGMRAYDELQTVAEACTSQFIGRCSHIGRGGDFKDCISLDLCGNRLLRDYAEARRCQSEHVWRALKAMMRNHGVFLKEIINYQLTQK